MKQLCFLTALLFMNLCSAQSTHSSRPSNYASVGAYSLNFKDVFSFSTNQASLAGIKTGSAGIYSERKYMLKELKRFSAAVAFPFRHGGVGIATDYFGYAAYNESHAGIAYGRALGEKIDVGVQFNYHRISMAGYGSGGTINFEIGTIGHLTDKLQVGCHLYNPVGGKFGKNYEEKIASVCSFGTGYEASEKMFITAAIIKEENQPVNVNVSLQYAFVKRFFLRAGMASAVAGYFAGTGIAWKNLRIDVAVDWHPQAGLTPCLLMIFALPQSKAEQE